VYVETLQYSHEESVSHRRTRPVTVCSLCYFIYAYF